MTAGIILVPIIGALLALSLFLLIDSDSES